MRQKSSLKWNSKASAISITPALFPFLIKAYGKLHFRVLGSKIIILFLQREREREPAWRLHHLLPTTQRKKHQTFLIREQLRYQPVFQTSPKTLKTQLKVSKTLVISFAFDCQRSTSFPRTQNFLSFVIYP